MKIAHLYDSHLYTYHKLALLNRAVQYYFSRRSLISLESVIAKWLKKLELDYYLESVFFYPNRVLIHLGNSQSISTYTIILRLK